jgi:guanosine-3',5'-bis(diphosphate) 3'-pyrophosphohydrolase
MATSRCTRRWSARSARRSSSRSARATCSGGRGRRRRALAVQGREGTAFSDLQKRTHQWLQSLLDIQSQTGDSLEFIEHVKVDLFPDAVYVFTPRGQIRALPRGATIIDFAYSVHTDVGDHTVAAKVNQEQVPLRTELQNGDVVEIITDPRLEAPTRPGWASCAPARRAPRSGTS